MHGFGSARIALTYGAVRSRKEAVIVDMRLFSFDSLPSTAISVAVFLALIGISTDAARADCALSEKNIALARVVSKEAKLYFISGPRKGAPECPSAASACRQKGYLVPGDEILTNSTDDLCAQAAPDCWRCSGHQGGGVDAVLRPLPTKMRSADLGAAAAWQASIAKKGLGGDRGRPE